APALDAALALHETALRIHREGWLLRASALPEVLREDPEPVAGFLRLAAVGVEDAQPEVGARRGHEQENAVRADAPVPVADTRNRFRRERRAQVLLVDDDVVVAEPVTLREGDHGRGSSTRRPLAAET